MFNALFFIDLSQDSVRYYDDKNSFLAEISNEVTTAENVAGKAVITAYHGQPAFRGKIDTSTLKKINIFRDDAWLREEHQYLVENIIGQSYLGAINNAHYSIKRLIRPIFVFKSISLWRELSFAEYRWLAERSLVTASKVALLPVNKVFEIASNWRGIYSVVARELKPNEFQFRHPPVL